MVHTDNPQPTRHPRRCTAHSTRTKKLFLVDLADSGTVARIVSFVVVGG